MKINYLSLTALILIAGGFGYLMGSAYGWWGVPISALGGALIGAGFAEFWPVSEHREL